MCGIFGSLGAGNYDERLKGAKRAINVLAHRGPDGEGLFITKDNKVILAHRRLAIIDPEYGKQPMHSEDGLLTVVFNGAIYNYLELRRDLISKGYPIRSFSDTEVLLYAFREWGEDCVNRFLGMFSFAIWDNNTRSLFCARDRIGIKPFYFTCDDNQFTFASEIKAIISSGALSAEPDYEGLKDYLTFQFCIGKKTLFRKVQTLEPGCSMTVKLDRNRPKIVYRRYWDLDFKVDDVHNERWFIDHLATLIDDSIRIHLRSDVPLGAHLSGGLDSTAIVCMAASICQSEKIRTFTGAFTEGPHFDETHYAKTVADYAGTDYNEIFIPGSEMPEVLPRLIYFMDEPASGPGLIPQYYVSRLAAKQVKVVLGGQGGDELFIGYTRYLVAYLEKCLAGAIFETADNNRFAVSLESIIPNLPTLQSYLPMLRKFWKSGLFDSEDCRYFKLVDRSDGMQAHLFDDVFDKEYSPFDSFRNIFNRDGLHSLINRITYFDLKASLPALLHVEDRTSMAASLESRVPLLDHRIVEFMARVPPNIKFAGGRMKHLFKEAVRNKIPAPVLERKDKMGFTTPLNHWVNGVAKDFVHDTLFSSRARQRGLYNIPSIEAAIGREGEFGRIVWGLLCIELWFRIFIDGDIKFDA